ncbi:WD40/YVTN/BNR-like repeat-containing protein [Paenibacillus glufosinatiresistens]|uniref:WD40/YVTN/BNR-like repeat-containing protein n=1 Tax=Paenibacillus glufosinatiresistens TaxID=3070657 RepID=UPI00286D7FA9|nr:hypothetical protein [Paenibacillus sp. YX.27]
MKKDNRHSCRTAVTLKALLAAVLILGGAGPRPAPTASAAPASKTSASCGTGDHGLLQSLQAGAAAENTALHFTDLDFLSAGTGRAAGPGFLIGTSDGGCSFQTIYQGQWQFADIEFPNNVEGWALASTASGTGRYLIRTADGGSTWKRIDGLPLTMSRIDFPDRRTGFAYDWASAYVTGDGGSTWSKLPLPANTRGAAFASRNLGYASVVVPGTGYRVMKTADGGKHWKKVLTVPFDSPYYTEIRIRGSQVWAVLYGGVGMSQTSYSLYASRDGGSHWRRVIAADSAGGGPAPGTGPALLTEGPAAGKPGNLSLASGGAAFLLGYSPAGEQIGVGRSTDGGLTWSNRSVLPGYDGSISFAGPTTGWMAADTPKGWALYATGNGGMTWSKKFSFLKREE